MGNLAFDTHKFVTDLNKAGMDTPMAEVLAKHYADLLNDRIATKDDILVLEERLNGRMTSSEERLNGRMTSLEERMNARFVSSQLTVILAVCTILGSLMVVLQG